MMPSTCMWTFITEKPVSKCWPN